jgi:hypothetical protein
VAKIINTGPLIPTVDAVPVTNHANSPAQNSKAST